MTVALRAQVAPVRSDPQLAKHMMAPDAPLGSRLFARLTVDPASLKALQLHQHDAVPTMQNMNSTFMDASDVCRSESGQLIAVLGEPMLAETDAGEATTSLNAGDLLDLYETYGNACLEMLRGCWALVIVDPAAARVLLANDRMGRCPLYYCLEHNAVAIGSSLQVLSGLAGATGPDAQSLYQYVYFHMVPAPAAVLQGCNKLPAASLLELSTEGKRLSRYWNPVFRESSVRSRASAHAELKSLLKAAVRRCTKEKSSHAEEKVGAFLSGGLDSSTVAGMLSEIQGGSCDAYGIGFDVDGYDEMAFARITARHFGIRLHEHRVSPDEIVQALPDLAARSDEPFGNSSVIPAYFCARMAAADGIDVMLAGDGGDELFAGNTRYAGQQVFEDYNKLPRWLRTHVIESVLRALPGTVPLVSKGRSFVRQANMPLPQRLQYYGFLEQNSPDSVFLPRFLSEVDAKQPIALLSDIYRRPEQASTLNRMLFLDWQITLADNDLRKVNLACALAGVAVRYPMLDDELVAYSTTVPSEWKLPGGNSRGRRLRHFYKKALRGWLPEATIHKGKHGFGLPFGVWMRDHKPLQQLACDNLLALKARGIFQPRFLDQAIASHRDGHAAYYGELIWVLMCLELWLAARQPNYRFGRNA